MAAEKRQLDKFTYTGYFERPVDGSHNVKADKHVSKLGNICMTQRASPATVLLHDKRKWEHTYAEMAHVSFTRLELMKQLAQLLGLQDVLDTNTHVSGCQPASKDPWPRAGADVWSGAAEFKLRSRTHVPPINLKQTVGLLSQVYGAWCGAHLKNMETRQRQRQRQR